MTVNRKSQIVHWCRWSWRDTIERVLPGGANSRAAGWGRATDSQQVLPVGRRHEVRDHGGGVERDARRCANDHALAGPERRLDQPDGGRFILRLIAQDIADTAGEAAPQTNEQ